MRSLLLAAIAATALAPAVQAAEVKAVSLEGNVVEFAVLAVTVPSRLPNYCAVSAVVDKVWAGTAFRSGQPLALNVPCAEYGLIPANAWNDGFTPVNARSLQQSGRGIARLTDAGELVWHHGGLRQYGQWGSVAGYRVLDARMIPVQRS